MNAQFIENKYRIRIQGNTALRLKFQDDGTRAGVIKTNEPVPITVNRELEWVFVPNLPGRRSCAGMQLKQLQEYWDDLILEIDVYRIDTSWTQVKEWNEVEFTPCPKP